MKKVKVKIPAKINLTLDISGVENGYHILESLVASVDIFDTVTVKPRRDDIINLRFNGVPIGISGNKSNAYRTAERFKKEFATGGADIYVKRDIPAAAGLGGSSADIAGVLLAMQKLYDVKKDLTFIANELGSDVAYMLKGGFAVMKGRGDKVDSVTGIKRKFYLNIITADKGVSTVESYTGYDEIGKMYPKNTSAAVKLLKDDDAENFLYVLKNDLFDSSAQILPEICRTVKKIRYGVNDG